MSAGPLHEGESRVGGEPIPARDVVSGVPKRVVLVEFDDHAEHGFGPYESIPQGRSYDSRFTSLVRVRGILRPMVLSRARLAMDRALAADPKLTPDNIVLKVAGEPDEKSPSERLWVPRVPRGIAALTRDFKSPDGTISTAQIQEARLALANISDAAVNNLTVEPASTTKPETTTGQHHGIVDRISEIVHIPFSRRNRSANKRHWAGPGRYSKPKGLRQDQA